jgi:hypothetical protein
MKAISIARVLAHRMVDAIVCIAHSAIAPSRQLIGTILNIVPVRVEHASGWHGLGDHCFDRYLLNLEHYVNDHLTTSLQQSVRWLGLSPRNADPESPRTFGQLRSDNIGSPIKMLTFNLQTSKAILGIKPTEESSRRTTRGLGLKNPLPVTPKGPANLPKCEIVPTRLFGNLAVTLSLLVERYDLLTFRINCVTLHAIPPRL